MGVRCKGTTVKAARTDDLLTALYALVGMLKQRRAKFEKDAKTYGYATPTTEELVYWTYIYYNVGPYIGDKMQGGEGQLKKYQGTRTLSDWITKGEYLNAIKVLDTYKASRDIFSGFTPTP